MKTKKFLSIVLSLCMIFGITAGLDFSAKAATNGHSQSDAINYLNSKIGTQIGDGQCPALARDYYSYLGYSVSGDGKDYENNVPNGWVRTYYYSGYVPQPGDVAVWRATNSDLGKKYGHVAIVESATESSMNCYEQGNSAGKKVRINRYLYGNVTCFIRPDFTGIQNNGISVVNATNIKASFSLKNPQCLKITKFVTQIKPTDSTSWKGFKKEYDNNKAKSINRVSSIGADSGCKYTFSENKSYDIRAYAVIGGKTYYSNISTFIAPARIPITDVSISGLSSKYTGSNIDFTSLIKLTNSDGTVLQYGKDYTLSTKGATEIGKYKVTITGIGNYKGKRTGTFKIYPKTPTIKSLSYTKSTNRIGVKWNRVANCTKQEIAISTTSNFTSSTTYKFLVSASTESCTINKMKFGDKTVTPVKGKTYYVKMRAYKVVDGEKIYGKWGTAKSIKISK